MAMTFDDFCFLLRDGQKGDLIDGVIYVASPEMPESNRLFLWLMVLFGQFVEDRGLGRVFASRVAFRLGEWDGPEPDIAFVRTARGHLILRGYVNGSPDLAVEIVSPDSVERDYKLKREQYRRHGVTEYWIVDEIERRVTLLHLSGDEYREMRRRKGELRSVVLDGFRLRAEWLWQKPRPKLLDVLPQVLGRALGSSQALRSSD
jgi:Uma2 family endonuclease